MDFWGKSLGRYFHSATVIVFLDRDSFGFHVVSLKEHVGSG